jgi:signal peptidase I
MRPPGEDTKKKRGEFGETVRTIVSALVIALVIRTFLFQPFNIPSGSMEPTLLIGDYLFVSKFTYGYSHFSFPFSPPLFRGRLLGAEPQRGDIVVFRPPNNESTDFIKRIIGLPGDRIQVVDGVVHINDAAVQREPMPDFFGEDPCRPGGASSPPVHVKRWRETLPNHVSYETLQCTVYGGFPDTTSVYRVPAGHFFMMGDNRENSDDSRFPEVGYVPFENLIGRAQIIFFSIEGGSAWQVWRWPWAVRWSRLLTVLH